MAYVKVENGQAVEYPYGRLQLVRDNPATSFPKSIGGNDTLMESYGCYPVTIQDDPAYDSQTQYIQHPDMPSLVNNVWTITPIVVTRDAEDQAIYDELIAGGNRGIRDRLIAATDWWASSDLTMTPEQTAYRQALRDITTHANWPHLSEDDWPTKP